MHQFLTVSPEFLSALLYVSVGGVYAIAAKLTAAVGHKAVARCYLAIAILHLLVAIMHGLH